MAYPVGAWPITSQGATDVERQAGEIEREENQPFGASKMIRFSAGVKVCAASESPSSCSPSMSPIYGFDVGQNYTADGSKRKGSFTEALTQLSLLERIIKAKEG